MHLISYDIQHDGLRTKIANSLLRYGLHRVQYSVFIGDLKDSTFTRLQKELEKFSKHANWTNEDSTMVLPLHQYSEDHLIFIGKAPERWLEIKGELHTLVL